MTAAWVVQLLLQDHLRLRSHYDRKRLHRSINWQGLKTNVTLLPQGFQAIPKVRGLQKVAATMIMTAARGRCPTNFESSLTMAAGFSPPPELLVTGRDCIEIGIDCAWKIMPADLPWIISSCTPDGTTVFEPYFSRNPHIFQTQQLGYEEIFKRNRRFYEKALIEELIHIVYV